MNSFPINIDNPEVFKKVFDNVDYILTDCDGVLWLHNTVIDGSDTFLNEMRKKGKKIVFATNNSTKSRRIILQKFKDLGFEANAREIMVTSYAAGIYLKNLNFDKKVYVFGSTGIEEEFKLLNINFIGVGPDPLPRNLTDFSKIELDPEVEAVVLGFDYEISYPKLIKACSYGKKIKPELFIATNLDETLPTTFTNLCVPGTGALVSSIQTAVGRNPVAMGKPGKFFFDCIKTVYPDILAEKTIMIGDRLNTDIEFAHNSKIKYSLLVESGVGTLEDVKVALEQRQFNRIPTHYCKNLGELVKFL